MKVEHVQKPKYQDLEVQIRKIYQIATFKLWLVHLELFPDELL